MGYTDIILEGLQNIYIIQATLSYFIKTMDLLIWIMYLLWVAQFIILYYVFEFHNSYIDIAELCTIHYEPNFVRIMYSTTHWCTHNVWYCLSDAYLMTADVICWWLRRGGRAGRWCDWIRWLITRAQYVCIFDNL